MKKRQLLFVLLRQTANSPKLKTTSPFPQSLISCTHIRTNTKERTSCIHRLNKLFINFPAKQDYPI